MRLESGRLVGDLVIEWGTTPAAGKPENQDWAGGRLLPGGGVGVVCDGVGAARKGGEGARIVGEGVLEQLSENPTPRELEEVVRRLHLYLSRLNWEAGEHLYLTTLVVVVVQRGRVFGVNVGDSRFYHYSPHYWGGVRLLSVDDHYSELPNLLFQAVGDGSPLNIHHFSANWERGDLGLGVTDGVYRAFQFPAQLGELFRETGVVGVLEEVERRNGLIDDATVLGLYSSLSRGSS